MEMNAYELADRLDLEPYGIYGEQAANTLRQQASELDKVIPELVKANGIIENLRIRIAELEKALAWQTKRKGELFDEMSKQIAELEKDLHMLQRHYDQLDHDTQGNCELISMGEHDVVVRMPIEEWQSILLTPQTKPLSDEEIDEIMKQTSNWYEFARAILKKASQ